MKMMGDIRYVYLVLLLALPVLLTACSFRDILDDYPVSGIKISFIWEGVDELPEGMRIIFYPKSEEGRMVDDYLSVEGGEVKVPPGRYDLVIYNYNTECVVVEGTGSYETIKARTVPYSDMNATEDMVWGPDPFYVVNMKDIRIEKSDEVLAMEFKPKPVVRHYTFEIKVKGLKNVASIVCNVSGMDDSYCISSGACTSGVAPIYVEAVRGDDVIRGSFSAFSDAEAESTRAAAGVMMRLLLIKVDNTVQEAKVDITEAVGLPSPPDGGGGGGGPATEIEIPIDEEIEVEDVEVPPDGDGGGMDGDVNDWDDETNVELPVV